jgi:DNA-directed RNA polymerase specialized sigma subunit
MSRPFAPSTLIILDILADKMPHSRESLQAVVVEQLIENHSAICIEAYDRKPPKNVAVRVTRAFKIQQGAVIEFNHSRQRLISRKVIAQTANKSVRLAAPQKKTIAVANVRNSETRLTHEQIAKEYSAGGIRIGETAKSTSSYIPNLVINGIDESQIWEMAPAFPAERMQWHFEEEFAPESMTLPCKFWTRKRSDGRGRIWVTPGQGEQTRVAMTEWLNENNISLASGIRLEVTNVSYRDVSQIPKELVDGILIGTTKWLMSSARATVQKVALDEGMTEPSEIQSLVYMFVSDLLDTFQDKRPGAHGKSLNFRAYALGKVKMWKSDRLRQIHGRRAVDEQTQYVNAQAKFVTLEGRNPSDRELAQVMRTSVENVFRISNENRLRSNMTYAHSIVGGGNMNEGDVTINVADVQENTSHLAETTMQQAAISRAIVKNLNPKRPVDLVVLYNSYYQEHSVKEIAHMLGSGTKTVAAAQERLLNNTRSTLVSMSSDGVFEM